VCGAPTVMYSQKIGTTNIQLVQVLVGYCHEKHGEGVFAVYTHK
jgi:hypothetical protein